MRLSDKLIALRKENGWSQEEFAEKLDVSRQAISRWENGTALPDALNILGISKLFNVTADYLLNDDYEDKIDIPVAETIAEDANPSVPKRRHLHWYLILIIFITWAVCTVIGAVNSARDVHTHPALSRVIENQVEPTCTVEGSYDEVLYCTECGEEVLRTHIISGMPAHQFENEKCTVCGEEQRARG